MSVSGAGFAFFRWRTNIGDGLILALLGNLDREQILLGIWLALQGPKTRDRTQRLLSQINSHNSLAAPFPRFL